MLPIKSLEQVPKPSRNGNDKNGKVSAHDSSIRQRLSRLAKESDSEFDRRSKNLSDGSWHDHTDMLPNVQLQPIPRNRRDGGRGNDEIVRHLQR
jgi:hypothetical protein